jgi:hypothetical protein
MGTPPPKFSRLIISLIKSFSTNLLLIQKMRTPRTLSVERARLVYRCRLVLHSMDGILISCLSTYVFIFTHDGHGDSLHAARSSTSLAVVAFSKLPPLPMVSHTAHQRQYLNRFLRVVRRPRLLRLPAQMARFYVSSSET